MFEIRDVTRTYRKKTSAVHALRGVSLRLEPGEFVAVKGESGCGKTTLLLIAGGLLAPSSGGVFLDGDDPYALTAEERARWRARNVGFVFQQFHLVPYLTVRENIMAAALYDPADGIEQRSQQLMEQFKLGRRASHLPAELSTGERQRTALARALMNRPKLLLADEPTGNLDSTNALIVLQYLQGFARAGGAVLLVTHSAEAVNFADRSLEMSAGQFSASVAQA